MYGKGDGERLKGQRTGELYIFVDTSPNKAYELVCNLLLNSITGGCKCLTLLLGLDALLAESGLFYRVPIHPMHSGVFN